MNAGRHGGDTILRLGHAIEFDGVLCRSASKGLEPSGFVIQQARCTEGAGAAWSRSGSGLGIKLGMLGHGCVVPHSSHC